MSNAGRAPRARRIPAPAEEPVIGSDRFDYADAFEIRVHEPDARTAERFVRCAWEQAPWLAHRTVLIAQRDVMRLRLGPLTSPNHVAGWKIVTSRPEVIHLETTSPLFRCVIVGRRVDPTYTVIATYVAYRRPTPARIIWTILRPLHRRFAIYLVEYGAANGAESPAATPNPLRPE